jgi:hypothetical protein
VPVLEDNIMELSYSRERLTVHDVEDREGYAQGHEEALMVAARTCFQTIEADLFYTPSCNTHNKPRTRIETRNNKQCTS